MKRRKTTMFSKAELKINLTVAFELKTNDSSDPNCNYFKLYWLYYID